MAEGSFLGQSTDLRLVILALNRGFAILPSVTLKQVRHVFCQQNIDYAILCSEQMKFILSFVSFYENYKTGRA